MMNRFIVAGVMITLTAAVTRAQPAITHDWALPRTDADAWARRVRALVPDKGWTVSVKGNDIAIQRDKPVQWAAWVFNLSGGEPEGKPPLHEGPFRLTLTFGPKMSMQEHERLAAENVASDKEQERLRRGLAGITQKFEDYAPRTPEEQVRVAAYRDAVAKLHWTMLPDLYCQDYSLWLFISNNGNSSVYGEGPAEECNKVHAAVLRFFAMYDPKTAADPHNMDRPEHSVSDRGGGDLRGRIVDAEGRQLPHRGHQTRGL